MDGIGKFSKGARQTWSHSKALEWGETDVPQVNEHGSGKRLSFVVIIGVHTGNQAGRMVEGMKSCSTSKSLTLWNAGLQTSSTEAIIWGSHAWQPRQESNYE